IDPAQRIAEREEAGRFIPITRVTSNADLKYVITSLIPLLHTEAQVADPIKYVVSELGRNALEHSRSPVGAFMCAQYYRDLQRLSIGVADAGIGMLGSMRRSHALNTSEEAILMALQPGITGVTRRIGGNESNA